LIVAMMAHDARLTRMALLPVPRSAARKADCAVVLEARRVVEEGRPEELICAQGKSAALVELEAAGWDWQSSAQRAESARKL
jgi:ABC-type multidrug transport system fused ATPase/permease subunit